MGKVHEEPSTMKVAPMSASARRTEALRIAEKGGPRIVAAVKKMVFSDTVLPRDVEIAAKLVGKARKALERNGTRTA